MRALPREAGKEKKEIAIRKAAAAFFIPAFFLFDRWTKTLILEHLPEGQSLAVWPGVFHLTRVNNTGAAFGLLKHSGGFLAFVSTASVLAFSIFLFSRFLSRTRTEVFAWGLVIAGAAGNLYDRVVYGTVIDFLDFRVWPVFNFADAGICAGAALIAFGFLKKGRVK